MKSKGSKTLHQLHTKRKAKKSTARAFETFGRGKRHDPVDANLKPKPMRDQRIPKARVAAAAARANSTPKRLRAAMSLSDLNNVA
jgi:hypothetical protein